MKERFNVSEYSTIKSLNLIYYATMLIGDSQTMTSEAAVLEEEHKYGLTYGFLPENFNALQVKIEKLLALSNLKEIWEVRRQQMLADKIDVTAFYVEFIEGYFKS